MNVSIVGGTGLLGRSLAETLRSRGVDVVVAGRSATGPGNVVADIESGDGIAEAISTAETVIHLASNPRKADSVDVAGTRKLLDALSGRRLIYISIVGVDRHPFSYYRAKHKVEQIIEERDRNHTILRATQFHEFLAFLVGKLATPPVCLVPKGFVFQPVSTSEVAEHLADLALSGAKGRQPDLGGPEILPVDHIARSYMEAIGRERPIVGLPLPGKTPRAFRDGLHTNPDRAVGNQTWADWLTNIDR